MDNQKTKKALLDRIRVTKTMTPFEKNRFLSPEEQGGERKKGPEWKEVPREQNVIVFGDLHSNWDALVLNGLHARVFVETQNETTQETELTWRGEKQHVVFVGDILGDRGKDGLRIMRALGDLQKQAQKEGGSVTILAGNHDIWFFAYLFGFQHADTSVNPLWEESSEFDPYDISREKEGAFKERARKEMLAELIRTGQARDLLSLLTLIPQQDPSPSGIQKIPHDIGEQINMLASEQTWNAIRHAIAEDTTGLQEALGLFHIIHQYDDTLFVHCDPTETLIAILKGEKEGEQSKSLTKALDNINGIFNDELRECLKNPRKTPSPLWRTVVRDFIKTERRFHGAPHLSQASEAFLREEGIHAIVFGHTKENPGVAVTRNLKNRLTLVTADEGALQPGINGTTRNPNNRSIVTIKTNGEIIRGANNELIRGENGPKNT